MVLAVGHVAYRTARMEAGRRYLIDVRDERHPVVYVNRTLTPGQLAKVTPEIEARLADWRRSQRRRDLVAVPEAELVGDEALLDAATGTDGEQSELAARQARLTFGLIGGSG